MYCSDMCYRYLSLIRFITAAFISFKQLGEDTAVLVIGEAEGLKEELLLVLVDPFPDLLVLAHGLIVSDH